MSIQSELRQLADHTSAHDSYEAETCRRAADRIELLEDALRRVQDQTGEPWVRELVRKTLK